MLLPIRSGDYSQSCRKMALPVLANGGIMGSLKPASKNITAISRRTTTGSPAGGRRKTGSSSRSSTSEAIRMRPINIRLRSDTPRELLRDFRKRFSEWIIAEPTDDELIELGSSSLWKNFESRQSPGSWISGFRTSLGWTQKDLGSRLGGVSTARVSDWEHDRRAVSKEYAKKLSVLFGISADKFF
jgi:DNA-binding transcriptional regulator YiaG